MNNENTENLFQEAFDDIIDEYSQENKTESDYLSYDNEDEIDDKSNKKKKERSKENKKNRKKRSIKNVTKVVHNGSISDNEFTADLWGGYDEIDKKKNRDTDAEQESSLWAEIEYNKLKGLVQKIDKIQNDLKKTRINSNQHLQFHDNHVYRQKAKLINLVKSLILYTNALPLWTVPNPNSNGEVNYSKVNYPLLVRIGNIFNCKETFTNIIFGKLELNGHPDENIVSNEEVSNRIYQIYMEMNRMKKHAEKLLLSLGLIKDGIIDRLSLVEFVKPLIKNLNIPKQLYVTDEEAKLSKYYFNEYFNDKDKLTVNEYLQNFDKLNIIELLAHDSAINTLDNKENTFIMSSQMSNKSNSCSTNSSKSSLNDNTRNSKIQSYRYETEEFKSDKNLVEHSTDYYNDSETVDNSNITQTEINTEMQRKKLLYKKQLLRDKYKMKSQFIDDKAEVSNEEEENDDFESIDNIDELVDMIDLNEFTDEILNHEKTKKLYAKQKENDEFNELERLKKKYIKYDKQIEINQNDDSVYTNSTLFLNDPDILNNKAKISTTLFDYIDHENNDSSYESFIVSDDDDFHINYKMKETPSNNDVTVANIDNENKTTVLALENSLKKLFTIID